MRRWTDGGQAAPLGAMVLGMAAVLGWALAGVASDAVDAARARTAADAAALAGVTGGRAAAEQLAASNGGSVVSWTERAGTGGIRELVVSVRVGDATAQAAATGE